MATRIDTRRPADTRKVVDCVNTSPNGFGAAQLTAAGIAPERETELLGAWSQSDRSTSAAAEAAGPRPWRWVIAAATMLLLAGVMTAVGIAVGAAMMWSPPGPHIGPPDDGGPTIDNTLPWTTVQTTAAGVAR